MSDTAESRNAQAMRALGEANRVRSDQATARRQLRNGSLTLREALATRPPALRSLTLFAVLLDLPGFGQRKLARLNRLAIGERINLAVTLGEASDRTLGWVARTVTAETLDPELISGGDHGWRAVAVALDASILEHERSVRDESLPVERWAHADDRLHAARAELETAGPPRDA